MNLFQKYGIKEVADVTFYDIIKIGDEELYIPVLFLDTLKVSDITQSANKTSHNGGYGNQQIQYWEHSKKYNVKIEDALFSPASLEMSFGWTRTKITKYISLIKKLNIVNSYYDNNYSKYTFQSPKLNEKEQELLFSVFLDKEGDIFEHKDMVTSLNKQDINEPYVAEYRKIILDKYYNRPKNFPEKSPPEKLFSEELIKAIFEKINEVDDFYSFKNEHYNIQTMDIMEKCCVTEDEGLFIDIEQQIKNLYKYYNNDKSSNYFIFYDEKTMQPLGLFDKEWFRTLEGDQIKYKTEDFDVDEDGTKRTKLFYLKKGTVYYKWSRTIQPVLNDESFIGKSLVLDGNIFPGEYKIVGETYIRERNSTKDQRYQFVINHATIPVDQKIELRADGGASVFSMNLEVLVKDEESPIELRQFNVKEDEKNGGTKVVPQKTQYTRTKIFVDNNETEDDYDNNEIY